LDRLDDEAAIDGVATPGLDIDAIIARLRGAPGTEAVLETRRVGVQGSNRIVVVRGLIQPRGVDVNIGLGADGLIEANGLWPILDFDLGKPIRLAPIAKDEFKAAGDDLTRIQFVRDADKIVGAILDPGPDELRGYGSIDAGLVAIMRSRIMLTFPSLLQQKNAP
jgi:hypothetical protein